MTPPITTDPVQDVVYRAMRRSDRGSWTFDTATNRVIAALRRAGLLREPERAATDCRQYILGPNSIDSRWEIYRSTQDGDVSIRVDGLWFSPEQAKAFAADIIEVASSEDPS